jgi:hypothetical protein
MGDCLLELFRGEQTEEAEAGAVFLATALRVLTQAHMKKD